MVTEDTPPAPTTPRGARRLAAEHAVRAWCEARGAPWVILRVPGIYGPGRLPLERLRRGDPSIAESEAGPGNRIHVDDLVTVLRAAGESLLAVNRVYNCGDGDHASSTVYFRTVGPACGIAGTAGAAARTGARARDARRLVVHGRLAPGGHHPHARGAAGRAALPRPRVGRAREPRPGLNRAPPQRDQRDEQCAGRGDRRRKSHVASEYDSSASRTSTLRRTKMP
jgi:hypothetical protein